MTKYNEVDLKLELSSHVFYKMANRKRIYNEDIEYMKQLIQNGIEEILQIADCHIQDKESEASATQLHLKNVLTPNGKV